MNRYIYKQHDIYISVQGAPNKYSIIFAKAMSIILLNFFIVDHYYLDFV